MLRTNSLAMLLCAVVAPLFIGCEPSQTIPTEAPVVVLETSTLNVDGGGGVIPIFYRVENARQGVYPKAKSNVDWVVVEEIVNGAIMLFVEASDLDEERMGVISITYEGMERTLKVTVLQDSRLLDDFAIAAFDVTHSSCSIKYTPKHSGGYFMANIIDSTYFSQSGISDMEMFIAEEMSNYLALAKKNNMTLEYLLEEAVSPQLLFSEEVTRHFSGMQPGATYVAYAYGLELKGDEYTVTIPFHSIMIDIPLATLYDVTFNISPQKSSSGIVSIAIEPVGWRGYYVVNIIPDNSVYYVPKGERISESVLRAMGNDFYKKARKAIQSGVSVEAFLKSSCYSGSKSLALPLDSDSNYMVAVYAVESVAGDIPVMCSMPSIAYL